MNATDAAQDAAQLDHLIDAAEAAGALAPMTPSGRMTDGEDYFDLLAARDHAPRRRRRRPASAQASG